jgi:hypothetical protein
MEVKLLRRGSKGLEGTYQNIEHHAIGAFPVVKVLVEIIKANQFLIEKWTQGHNTHLITSKDNRTLVFTPFKDDLNPHNPYSGVEVRLYVSRTQRVRLFVIDSVQKAYEFDKFLRDFLEIKRNFYGLRKGDSEE